MAQRDAITGFYQALHGILTEAAGVPCYSIEPPRRDDGALDVEPPFVAYSESMTAPTDEGGSWSIGLQLDAWSTFGTSEALGILCALDAALNGTARRFECGTICADRSGLCFQRMEHDPHDARIRRARSNYLIRFDMNPE